jgi:hypothetical protein
LEAAQAEKEGDTGKYISLTISGLIQFTMLFDPLNIGTLLKEQVSKLFNLIAGKAVGSAAKVTNTAAESAAGKWVGEKLNSLVSGISKPLGKFISAVQASTIGRAVSSTLQKLGVGDFIAWLKTFFTEKIPNAVKTFLGYLAKLNVNNLGVDAAATVQPIIINGINLAKTAIQSAEKSELGGKTIAKFTGNLIDYFSNGISNSKLQGTLTWQQIQAGSFRDRPDATYIQKPILPKDIKQ